jgi:hypothetical protein
MNMHGLLIEYEYNGDEAAWADAIQTFCRNIAADPRLASGLRYHVFVRADGRSRVHVPSWDNELTLAHLQSQEFFKTFAAAVKRFAGDTLRTTKIKFAV